MLSVLEEAIILRFAYGLTVVVAVKHPEDMEVYETETVITTNTWLEKAELTLMVENSKRS